MKLIIVRHGESQENSEGVLQGLLPGNLSEKGMKQANETGKMLAGENIDVVYSSPLGRCRETTEHILPYLKPDVPVNYDDLLRERDFGKLSGVKRDTINFEMLDQDNEQNRANGVETLEEIRKRILAFLQRIQQKHSDQTVLAISHSNPIRVLLGELMHMTYEEVLQTIRVKNASVSIFEIGKETTSLRINDTTHLT